MNKIDKLYIDFNTSIGPRTLGEQWPFKFGIAHHSRAPRALCAPNRPLGVKDYHTRRYVKWHLIPTLKSPSSNALYSHHITINPNPSCMYILNNTLNEHLAQFEAFLKNIQNEFLYKRLLAVYENENKKTHFHILVHTKKIREITAAAQLYFAGIKHSNYAVISKPITLNHQKSDFLKKMPLRERKILFNESVMYIQNVYFQKENHNKNECFLFSEYKNI